ncbi:nitroreductase, partial [Acinetobacter baumannii]
WHFVVLQNRDIINQMSDIVTESHTQIANLAPTKEQGEKYMRLLKYYTLFKHAPVVIIVYGNEYDMIEYDILKANGASEERLAEIIAPQSAIQGIGAAVE